MCKIGLFIRISLNSLQEPTIAVNLDGISRYNRHAVTVTVKRPNIWSSTVKTRNFYRQPSE